MANKRLLIIEDDLNLTLALYRALSHTYKVATAKTAASGLKKAELLELDLIILDLNLPDLNGAKVLVKLRERGINVPVLILSGESSLISKVDQLNNGASDYVTKPFSLAELKARIAALLRQPVYYRHGKLVSKDLILDPTTRRAIRDGRTIDLRRKEFALLECLFRNSGVAVERRYLLEYAWGNATPLRTNSIDVHIKSLRDKIDRGYDHKLIKTVHGLGYALDTGRPKAGID